MNGSRELRAYLWGLAFSVALTAIPFGLVAMQAKELAIWALALCGLAQVGVHLRFFLHLRWRGQQREDLQMVHFTLLILIFMIGGTVWILSNLAERM